MGDYLSAPIKTKESEDGDTPRVRPQELFIVKIWSQLDARMEKDNGGHSLVHKKSS